MLALSIKQPWSWCILHQGKDIENRTWSTRVRGRVLIHVGQRIDDGAMTSILRGWHPVTGEPWSIDRSQLDSIRRTGGIIGSVEIVDCIARSDSPWWVGPYGFRLRDPQPLPFQPLAGRLGFFEVASPSIER